MIYFSMHDCPPCREFTALLTELYIDMNQAETHFEVVFVSCDKTVEQFHEYYSEMPWLAMPFQDPRIKNLAKTFKVRGVPRLVVLNPKSGAVIADQAVDLISAQGPVIIEEWMEKFWRALYALRGITALDDVLHYNNPNQN